MKTVVVLGGGYAGLLAAVRLARRVSREGVAVTLIDAGTGFTERVRLHQVAAAQPVRWRAYADILRGSGVRFVQGRAIGLDLAAGRVLLERGEPVGFDRLIYAVGSRSDVSAVPGADRFALAVADPPAALALGRELAAGAGSGRRVAIVGGGLTGVETAAEMAATHPGLPVSLVTAGAVAAELSEAGRRHIRRVLSRLAVDLREEAPVAAIEPSAVVLRDGGVLEADLIVWAGPFVASPLAAQSGLAVNERGQVRVDPTLRSRSHPAVYAAGDAATVDGRPLRMACATALPLGAHAADSVAAELAGGQPQPLRLRSVLKCLSLGRRDGVLQHLGRYEQPTGVTTGLPAAWIKEAIIRWAASAASLERRGIPYWWPGDGERHAAEGALGQGDARGA